MCDARRGLRLDGLMALGLVLLTASAQRAGAQTEPEGTPAAEGTAAETTNENAPANRGRSWSIVPTAGVAESVTDNVNDTPTGRKPDAITTISGGLDVTEKGANLTLTGNYSVSEILYAMHPHDDAYQQNLLAVANIVPVTNTVFVDVRTSIGQQPISLNGPISATGRPVDNNQTQMFDGSFSPYYIAHLGGWAVTTLTYELSDVTYLPTALNAVPSTLGDSLQHRVAADVASGGRFTDFTWHVGTFRTWTISDFNDLVQQTESLDLKYHLSHLIAVTGSGGYDRFTGTGDTLSSEGMSGIFWDGGLDVTPGPNSEATLAYGRRYGGPYITGSLSYRTPKGSSIHASYTSGVETQEQLLSSQLQGYAIGPNGQIINTLTGLPATANVLSGGLTNLPFRARTLTLGIDLLAGRNTLSLSGQDLWRFYGAGVHSDDAVSITSTLQRELTPFLTAALTLSAMRDSAGLTGLGNPLLGEGNQTSLGGPSVGGAGTTYTGSLNFNEKFTTRLTGAVTFSRLQRTGTASYSEDAGLVSVFFKY